jgi:hypothetical protein
MSGQSPFSMMHQAPQHAPQPRKRVPPRRHPLRLFLVALAITIVVALGWTWGWYYAAAIADRALSGWIDREAVLGRVYACGSQSIGGFPFSIVTDCNTAAATFKSNQPPFDVRATGVTFSAAVYRPTLLNGEVAGPVTLADPGQPPVFVANWSRAQIRLLGMPPAEPERVTITLREPRFDRVTGPGTGTIFQADLARVDGQIVQGSARDHPVIEVTARFESAIAPLVHPLLATALTADIDVVMRGFKDFSPKPWPVLFRDMQAEGGGIEIKSFRIERTDAIVVGTGRLSVNADGRLDGVLNVAVAGVENIVPLLGIDQMIGQGVNRLTGGSGSSDQGLNTLDRLLPGLGGIVRQQTNSSVVDTINKMGEPTEIDKKPAVALPLRVNDGVVSVGIIPVGVLPALF